MQNKLNFNYLRQDSFVTNHIINCNSDITDSVNISVSKILSHNSEPRINLPLLHQIAENLKSGSVNGWVCHLADLPAPVPDELVIAGLAKRTIYQAYLVMNLDCYDPTKDLKIKDLSKIVVKSDAESCLLKNLNPNCLSVVADFTHIELKEKILKKEIDAAIIEQDSPVINFSENQTFKLIPLHPTEFLPMPGKGVLAFLCLKEDLAIRKLTGKWHHLQTSECTNVERMLVQMLEDSDTFTVRAYCYKDQRDNVHASAALINTAENDVKFARVSQSTTHKMAENIFNKLTEYL